MQVSFTDDIYGPMDPLLQQLMQVVSDRMARDIDKMAGDMLLHNMLPHKGWRIGYTVDHSGHAVSWSVFPVAPYGDRLWRLSVGQCSTSAGNS